MTVNDSDLVISTYGRGFWILDDVTPLRQVRRGVASTAPAFFFTPGARVARAMGQHAGHAGAAGDDGRRQSARGRDLRLLPPDTGLGPVTLTISDAGGQGDPRILEHRAAARHDDAERAGVLDHAADRAADVGRHAPGRVGSALSGSAVAQLRLLRQRARLSRVHAELARASGPDVSHRRSSARWWCPGATPRR